MLIGKKRKNNNSQQNKLITKITFLFKLCQTDWFKKKKKKAKCIISKTLLLIDLRNVLNVSILKSNSILSCSPSSHLFFLLPFHFYFTHVYGYVLSCWETSWNALCEASMCQMQRVRSRFSHCPGNPFPLVREKGVELNGKNI